MKIFKRPNLSDDWRCPICKTNEKKEVILVPIFGTLGYSQNSVECEQFHLDCIDLLYDKRSNVLLQKIE